MIVHLQRLLGELAATTRSQWLVRLVGLLAAVGVVLLLPSHADLSGVAALAVLVCAVLAVLAPEPAGIPAVVLSNGVYLLLAPHEVTYARVPAAAALLGAQLCCLAITQSAPPRAAVDREVVRTYLRRWTVLSLAAVAVWGLLAVLGDHAPAPGDRAGTVLMLAALASVGACGGWVLGRRPEGDGSEG